MNKSKSVLIFLIVLIFLGAISFFLINSNNLLSPSTNLSFTTPSNIDFGRLPGIQTGSSPWTSGQNQLKQRLNLINLPALTTEGTALHTHQHLDIFINGSNSTVPSDIGIGPDESFISPIHTHDTTGIIHVESPTLQDYTLGQFFNIWGVLLTDQCLGGYCSNTDQKLWLYVDGKQINQNFAGLILREHQEIVFVYGPTNAQSVKIPSSYNFPPGY